MKWRGCAEAKPEVIRGTTILHMLPQLMQTCKTYDLARYPPLVLPEGSIECARQCWGRSGRRAVDSGGLPELPGAGESQATKGSVTKSAKKSAFSLVGLGGHQ